MKKIFAELKEEWDKTLLDISSNDVGNILERLKTKKNLEEEMYQYEEAYEVEILSIEKYKKPENVVLVYFQSAIGWTAFYLFKRKDRKIICTNEGEHVDRYAKKILQHHKVRLKIVTFI